MLPFPVCSQARQSGGQIRRPPRRGASRAPRPPRHQASHRSPGLNPKAPSAPGSSRVTRMAAPKSGEPGTRTTGRGRAAVPASVAPAMIKRRKGERQHQQGVDRPWSPRAPDRPKGNGMRRCRWAEAEGSSYPLAAGRFRRWRRSRAPTSGRKMARTQDPSDPVQGDRGRGHPSAPGPRMKLAGTRTGPGTQRTLCIEWCPSTGKAMLRGGSTSTKTPGLRRRSGGSRGRPSCPSQTGFEHQVEGRLGRTV